MRLLLTNDDGIDAPGLEALEVAACALGEVVVVAPLTVCSGCGHRVTTDLALRVEERGPGRFAVDGTPADCVRLALHGLAGPVDWVLSGINAGGNLGADVYHSGTVAAVREAALHGLPGVALSQYRRRGLAFDWARSTAFALRALRDVLGRETVPGGFWNVNFPHLPAEAPEPGLVHCPLDPSPLPLLFEADGAGLRYAGDYHQRRRVPGHDVAVCFGGQIAVSRLGVG
jgi:5'-nucleotidase